MKESSVFKPAARFPLWAAILTIVLMGTLLNLRVTEVRFLFDDIFLVVINPYIREAKGLLSYLEAGRPIRSLTLFIDYLLWGYNPRGYHITNLILHLACALLLFRFLDGKFTDRWVAWGAALLFAVHPAASEALAVVSHRKEMLALFFMLATLWCYLAASQPEKASEKDEWPGIRLWPYIFSFLFYLMGMGSKQVVIILPILAFVSDIFLSGKTSIRVLRRRWAWYLPYFLLPVVFMFLAIIAGKIGYLPDFFGDWNLFGYFSAKGFFGKMHLRILAISGWSVTAYTRMLVWPVFLSADHQFRTPGFWSVFSGVLLWFGMLGVGRYLMSKKSAAGFGLIWVPLNLLMVLNLIPANQPLADRYLYIPLAGFCLFLVSVMSELTRRDSIVWEGMRWAALMGIVIILISVNPFYRINNPPLLSMIPFFIAGTVLIRLMLRIAGKPGGVASFGRYLFFGTFALVLIISTMLPIIQRFQQGEWKKPDLKFSTPSDGLASKVYRIKTGKPLPPSTKLVRGSKKIIPIALSLLLFGLFTAMIVRFPWSAGDDKRANWMAVLGLTILIMGVLNLRRLDEWENAKRLWRATLRTDPSSFRASINLGVHYKKHKRMNKAEWCYRRAADINPRDFTTWNNLAILYLQRNDLENAEMALLQASFLNPKDVGSLLNLGNLYKITGRPAKARQNYEKILLIDPNNSKGLYSMALVMEEIGNYQAAYEYCAKALRNRPDFKIAREMCGPEGRLKAQTVP